MSTYIARSYWVGDYADGYGHTKVGSSAIEAGLSTRTRRGEITNPEELIGAALSGCFTLVFAKQLSEAGHVPNFIESTAAVDIGQDNGDTVIQRITLYVDVAINLKQELLQELAEQADRHCPVSRSLTGTHVEIQARPIIESMTR